MLDYLKGEIAELTPTSVVIEVGGLGYTASISLNTYSALTSSKDCKLYVYEAIREDAHQLFGFIEKRERELFLHLISVSGVGANTARMMLSSLAVYELEGIISSGNSSALKTVKGIGSKTAERIIIDLKDKVKPGVSSSAESLATVVQSETAQEAVSALVMLGFNQPASQKVVGKLVKDNPDLIVEQIIKGALKLL
ncbi:MAG: Holliday junction ATP-dependent DNA helicase RuvA [Candidatus Ordinivivax streblomastigis]|uniref:Holliday junction branch migration complex subunit RuvA n=1 Tax=Candidatus Ordinivivax streblomastigis TaxID=2540710 RepID=A0A5M8P0G6_9BACT|nr:MAG: Holliday junction ATP-dependent DNA helicase RuvA [Candidatus Ordinivivax streblomastigis]